MTLSPLALDAPKGEEEGKGFALRLPVTSLGPSAALAPGSAFPPGRLLRAGRFLRQGIIRKRSLVIDNRLNHVANVGSQEPIDRDTDKLRRIQDRASLHDRMNSFFLVRPKPDVDDSLGHWCSSLSTTPKTNCHSFYKSFVTRKIT